MDYIENGNQGKFTIITIEPDNKKVQKKSPIITEKPKTFRINARYYLQDFTDNVSIAGLKFLGEQGRSYPERIFWAIVIVIAIILSGTLVSQTFKKWKTSPVIVTFATSQMPIYKIPFPAVTICPETKTVKEKVNFTDIYIKVKRDEELTANDDSCTKKRVHKIRPLYEVLPYRTSAYDALSLICTLSDDEVNETAYYLNEDRLMFFMEIAPYVLDVVEFNWQKEDLNSTTANIIPILTADGVCYTFNGLDRSEIFNDHVYFPEPYFKSPVDQKSEWTVESGYKKTAGLNVYPRRTFLAGQEGGLAVRFQELMQDLDHICGDILKGFKVTVHHPAEIPRLTSNFFRVGINKDLLVVVTPNIVRTEEKLNHYSSQDRQCYFEEEKKLDFFKVYNQKNCLLECLTKFTLKFCGCVEFYMPRVNSTRICGIALESCTLNAKSRFMTTKILNNTVSYGETAFDDDDNYEDTSSDQCDCLPSCHSIDYVVQVSEDNVNFADYNKVMKTIDDDFEDDPENEKYLSDMEIYFKDMEFITSERNELYGYTDFWANVGGILGLFTGFSFITLFEILYYLSLRLMCNVKLFGKRFWSGSPNVLDEAQSNSKSK